MADGIIAELRKIPPVTRFLTLSLVGTTVPYLLNIVSPYTLLYHRDAVLKRLEIWRLYTSFFFGSAGINLIFEVAMLYQTANQLESGYDSADLAYQLFFACIGINILSTPLSATIFLRPLMHCLQYMSAARAPPGSQSSLFGMITLPTAYLPYTMLGIELLMGGPAAVARAAVGTIVGHLWWWRVWNVGGPNGAPWAKAPGWIRQYLSPAPVRGSGVAPTAGFHAFAPRTAQQPATSGRGWGRGQRLGG